ncbi:MAG: DNA methyltransferase [Patescibacteria group bacterium]
MSQYFLIFGNHPRLSLAEFLTLEPTSRLISQAPNACIVDLPGWRSDRLMDSLGGTVKLGDIILESDGLSLKPQDIAKIITQNQEVGALEFGWTTYGSDNKQKKIFEKYPIHIKKALKELGWKVRWVSGKGGEPLSPAAVAKCHLTEKPNADFCLMIEKGKVFLGRTTQVQDADAWSLRDYGRPCRDDVNGMLPPKLARMMVNLAQVPEGGNLLDPFCGSGTVLMEAALATAAKKIIGSDIDAKQITDTLTNLVWLEKQNIISQDDGSRFQTFISDVKTIAQHLPAKSIDAVVTEGWLGPLLKGRESVQELKKNAAQISRLWIETLKALRPILKDKASIVAVFPSFNVGNQVVETFNAIDLASLGYKLDELPAKVSQEDLYYERSGQHLRRNIRRLLAA